MRTTAALLVETGKPLVLASIETPALKVGQVLVEIAYSGACGTQVLEARGAKGEDKWVPHCMGHEASGTVLEIGPGVTRVKVGDRVALSWIKAGGIEAGGSVYDWEGRKVNAGAVTTFQRHTVASENRLTVLPPEMDMRLAILLGCALPTGMGAIFNVTKPMPGDSVAVFGAGGIGLAAILAASVSGCTPILAIDPVAMKREMALAHGATHAIDPTAGDPVAAIRKIVPGGVDAAVEATGLPPVMDQALQSVRQQGGRAVVVGNAHHGQDITLSPGLFNQGKSLLGTWGGDSVPDRDYGRYMRLMTSGRINVTGLLSAPYRLEDINQVLDDLAGGRIGRPLIDMNLR
ncbi:MAG: zinc-binding dehydrogenase [Alphaproteobacteria bacterium]